MKRLYHERGVDKEGLDKFLDERTGEVSDIESEPQMDFADAHGQAKRTQDLDDSKKIFVLTLKRCLL